MKTPLAQSILHTIESNQLFSKNEHILVALSGGIDSVVLTHILWHLGYSMAVAHCNFHLRGEESKRDEDFVRNFAHTHNLPLHCTEFDTTNYARTQGISIEMAARELRYGYFEELCTRHGYTKIAVAHHASDSVETFFINLLRGSGIKGLQGIPLHNERIVRPMLGAWRSEIEEYAAEHNLSFCFDSSNAETDFVRNKIRLTILPELQNIHKHAPQAIFNSITHLDSYYALAQPLVHTLCETLCTPTPYGLCVNETALLQQSSPAQLLYEILSPYQFNAAQVAQLFECFSHQAGKQFVSPTHAVYHDRHKLYIVEHNSPSDFPPEITLSELPHKSIRIPQGNLEFLHNVIRFTENTSAIVQEFSSENLQFPLTLRPWKSGDRIHLRASRGSKKVSDVLTEAKVPLHHKAQVWVLESAGNILWVIGYRRA
ncbi:MAG: tRNA lysidine(34) synthetase TilS [Bacteroidales bacterium]|jgi:tRNA(Ile)-lysidine synthase|nr:tRNA lysidine(34) synthetase TilS [Bacteroidales bacterium]